MGIKEKLGKLPYWFRGGIIGIIIMLFWLLLGNTNLLDYIVEILLFPIIGILWYSDLCRGEFCSETSVIIFLTFLVVEFFLIGAVIGWIVGWINRQRRPKGY